MKRLVLLTLVTLAVIAIAPASFATCFYCSVYQDCFMAGGTGAKCFSSGAVCMTSGRCDGACTPMVDCKKQPFQNGSLSRPLAMDYQIAAVEISRPHKTDAEASNRHADTAAVSMERN